MSVFSHIAGKRSPKAKFNLSHQRKMSLGLGDLIPTFVMDVLPGDNINLRTQELFCRMSPMISPIMHQIDVWTHYFFVPNRILWDGWEDFITGGKLGTTVREVPYLTMNDANRANFQLGRLGDFLNVKPMAGSGTSTDPQRIDAAPFRAYQSIWNEFFRDQTISNEVTWDKNFDGAISAAGANSLTQIKQRQYAKDYFTSALPWTQRGPEVNLPTSVNYKEQAEFWMSDGANPPSYTKSTAGNSDHVDLGATTGLRGGNTAGADQIRNIESLGLTINDLRNSNRLQQWLEAQARGGGRYIETILNHFGVLGDDARLQRPEYLGGNRNPLSVSEVLNTNGITDNQANPPQGGPQGTMAGHGVSVGVNSGFKKRFKEHGWVMGITSVVPKRAYQDGIDRSLQRFSKYDYYWPEFANLGEQAILSKELFFKEDDDTATNEATFGYTPRHAEYKHVRDSVHGQFREKLDHWHLGDKFSTRPTLSEAFLKVTPSQRIFAVYDERTDYNRAGEDLYMCVSNNVSAIRPMPYHSRPKL
jgi:hypothetical protein